MKDKQTKERFIELRGQGLPLKRIADEIGVSKTTLVNWEQDLKEQIDNLRAMELEALYDKYYLSTRKKVEFFGDVLSRIQGELETRDFQLSRRRSCSRCRALLSRGTARVTRAYVSQ